MNWQREMIREALLENRDILEDVIREIQQPTPTKNELSKLRNEHIQEKYDVSPATATRWMNALESEQFRPDSKVPSNSVVWVSDRVRMVDSQALEWFLENKSVLSDNIRRKAVPRFIKR